VYIIENNVVVIAL